MFITWNFVIRRIGKRKHKRRNRRFIMRFIWSNWLSKYHTLTHSIYAHSLVQNSCFCAICMQSKYIDKCLTLPIPISNSHSHVPKEYGRVKSMHILCRLVAANFYFKMKRSNVIVFDFIIEAFSLVDFFFLLERLSLGWRTSSHTSTVNLLIFTIAACLSTSLLFRCICCSTVLFLNFFSPQSFGHSLRKFYEAIFTFHVCIFNDERHQPKKTTLLKYTNLDDS